MIITRKFGKIFRGKATAPQLMMAALIGTTAGFMPGFGQAPGLLAALFLAALILNANLAVIGISLLLAKALSLALVPVTFAAGRFLLDGPTSGFFAKMINAPVLALFGFEYYLTTGGLAVGLVLGAILGVALVWAVQAFRRRMASLEKNSEKWKKFCARKPIRAFIFIFIGGDHGKSTYEELLAVKGGSPIRPLGLAAASLAIVCGYLLILLTGDEIAKMALQRGLEKANGATVDVGNVELQLREGRVAISGLAVADPNDLATDLFRADLIEGDISQADLLRKRIHIENLRVAAASSGETRAKPGILIRPLPEPPPAPKTDGKTFDDYVREAEKWKERLAQLEEWLEKISGPEETETVPGEEEIETKKPVEKIPPSEYATAVASHLIEGAPTVLVSRAAVEKLRVEQFPEETLEVVAENVSTHPRLVEKAPKIAVRSSADRFLLDANLNGIAGSQGANTVEFQYLDLPVDQVAAGLEFGGEQPLRGGTLDVRGAGNWSRGKVDLPLEVTLRKSHLTIANLGETPVEELVLPIGVTGRLANPRIDFSEEDLSAALQAAGKAELSRRLEGETDKLREKAEEKIGSELMERSKGLLDGFSLPKKK